MKQTTAPAQTSLADAAGGAGLGGSALRCNPTAQCAGPRFELAMGKNQYNVGKPEILLLPKYVGRYI